MACLASRDPRPSTTTSSISSQVVQPLLLGAASTASSSACCMRRCSSLLTHMLLSGAVRSGPHQCSSCASALSRHLGSHLTPCWETERDNFGVNAMVGF